MYTVKIRKSIPTRQFRKLVVYAQEICALYPDVTIEKINNYLNRWHTNNKISKNTRIYIFEVTNVKKVISIQHGYDGGAHVTISKVED